MTDGIEPMRVNDADRQRAAELLQYACGEGRLTLEEFSVRVGAVWAADTDAEIAHATTGLAQAPALGTQTVEKVVSVFGEHKRVGRWRLPGLLRVVNVFGSCELDLREALTGSDTVEIIGTCVFGEVKVIVPEGVEVELQGMAVFASRSMKLAAVPRLAGTPTVHVRINAYFGEVQVRSRGPASGSPLARWARELFS
jgi:hypothetical protein